MTPQLPDGERVVVTELGEEPLDAIERFARLEPMAAPDPATLDPRDVLVAIRSAAVGWVDLIMASGQYQHVPEPPYTPGLEYAGVVVAAGQAAGIEVGTPVMSDGMLVGPRSSGAYRRHGGFATYAIAPADGVRPIPAGLGFDEACNLLGSYETAYHCLIARGRLAAGETVLIHGASGATGLAAVHVAKRVGATVIATGRSEAKLAAVQAQGADHVIALPDAPARAEVLRDTIKSLTRGRGVDVVYDGVGGELSVESLRCVRFGARFLIVGWAATPNVARGRGQRGAPNANQLPTNLVMMKGLDVLGCPTVIGTQHDPSLRAPRLAWILREVAAGLRPHVSHAFPLADFKEALRAKWRGDAIGGCVVHP